ncbi:unnamed protein product [Amaranthus hypochondriacus]
MAISTTSSLFSLSTPLVHSTNILYSSQKFRTVFNQYHYHTNNISSYQPLISILTLSKLKPIDFHHYPSQKFNLYTKNPRNLRISATSSEDAAVIPAETAQQIVDNAATSGNDITSTVISVLLFIAFVALSVLTIGVISFLAKFSKTTFHYPDNTEKLGFGLRSYTILSLLVINKCFPIDPYSKDSIFMPF